jgi:lipopolysaccharide transport system permease protein
LVIPGVTIWLFFSQSLQNISNSITGNTNLIAKVYFPRLIIPFSSLLVGLIDVIITFFIFFVVCIWYQFVPDWKIIFAPIFILLSYLAAFGCGLFSAVLNVKYRDIGQIIPFIIQFGYFISPVAYSVESKKSVWWYPLYNLNPVAGAIDGLRWSMLGKEESFNYQSFFPLIIFILVSIIIAIRFFRKHENSFVDYL